MSGLIEVAITVAGLSDMHFDKALAVSNRRTEKTGRFNARFKQALNRNQVIGGFKCGGCKMTACERMLLRAGTYKAQRYARFKVISIENINL